MVRTSLVLETKWRDQILLTRKLSSRCIEWVSNCPANPEAGGVWERMVQSVKRVLKVTLSEEAPRLETLRAANIINLRPLTHLPVEPDDPEPITPNHFLIGRPNASTAPHSEPITCSRKQWRICKELSRKFGINGYGRLPARVDATLKKNTLKDRL